MVGAGGSLAILFADLLEPGALGPAGLAAPLAAWGGEEVKRTDRGLMAVFRGAGDALGCACEMARRAAAAGASVRAGVGAGEPTPDRGDWFGLSVNVARRLCDRAAPGQVLATALVARLAVGGPATRPLGAVDLRGVGEPVEAVEADPHQAPAGASGLRLRTLLATDMVGSTRMLADLGDDAAEEVRRAHVAMLRAAAWARGGREALSTGDGLVVSFAGARDALACAGAMQRAAARDARRGGPGLRVGVAVGEADAADERAGALAGAAQRLADATGAGEVLVAPEVRELLGSRGSFAFGAPGPGGVPLRWDAERPSPVPFPPLLARAGAGRSGPVPGALRSALARAAAGERTLVTLSARDPERGLRVAARAAREAHARGATVLAGAATPRPLAPLEPVTAALREYARECPLDELADRLRAGAGALAGLVPELAERLPAPAEPAAAAGEDPARVADAVDGVLSGAADLAPVVLVLAGMQHADAATWALVARLATAPRPAALLIVTVGDPLPDGVRPDARVTVAPGRRRLAIAAGAGGALVAAGVAVAVIATGGGGGPPPDAPPAGLPPLPAGWPPALRAGLFAPSEGPASIARDGARLSAESLSGGANTGRGWRTYDEDGRYAERFAARAIEAGLTPVLGYEQLRESLPGAPGDDAARDALANLREPATVRAWLDDLRALFAQLGTLTQGRAVVLVEPTLWPLAQLAARRDDPATIPVALSGSGDPVARGLPDDLGGLARAVVRLRDRTAPRVLLAYGTADWGGGEQVEQDDTAGPDVDILAGRVASAYRALGARFDLAALDAGGGIDAGLAEARDGARGALWTPRDYAADARFVAGFVRQARLRVVLMGLPAGNTLMRAVDGTRGHYRDNRVQTLLGDPARRALRAYRDAGVIGVVFGGGQFFGGTCPCDARGDGVTNPAPVDGNTRRSLSADDDGGYLRDRLRAYTGGGPLPG